MPGLFDFSPSLNLIQPCWGPVRYQIYGHSPKSCKPVTNENQNLPRKHQVVCFQKWFVKCKKNTQGLLISSKANPLNFAVAANSEVMPGCEMWTNYSKKLQILSFEDGLALRPEPKRTAWVRGVGMAGRLELPASQRGFYHTEGREGHEVWSVLKCQALSNTGGKCLGPIE